MALKSLKKRNDIRAAARTAAFGKSSIEIEESAALAARLSKQVLMNIAQLDAHRILKGQALACGRPRAPERRVNFYGNQPMYGGLLGHRHKRSEIATTVSGKLVVGIGRQIYRSSAGDWIICPPNVLHGEARLARRRPYEMLWLIERPRALEIHLTCYDPRHGYSTRCPVMLKPLPEDIRRIFCGIFAGEAAEPAVLRPLLLRTVAWCLEQLARAQPAKTAKPHTLVAAVRNLLDQSPEKPPSVPELAAKVGLSSNYLSSLFHRECGTTIRRYIESRRIGLACGFLRHSRHPVKEIAYSLGFADPQHFSHAFRRVMGASPLDYRGRVSEFQTTNR